MLFVMEKGFIVNLPRATCRDHVGRWRLTHIIIITLVNTYFVADKVRVFLGVLKGADSEYGLNFPELALVLEISHRVILTKIPY